MNQPRIIAETYIHGTDVCLWDRLVDSRGVGHICGKMLSTVRICYPWRYLFEIPSYARHHAVYIRYLRRFREIKFLTSASSTSRNFCILATLSIFFLFPKWKTIIVLSCPWFSDRETHRARNGWSKDLQLNRSYHRKSIKNRQFAPV